MGDKLFFSAYEESKKAEYLNAKPTNMDSGENSTIAKEVDGKATGSEDIDFESLL